MDFDVFNLSEVSWRDIAKDVKQKNESLFNAIESSSPMKDCVLIKARYPYGANIVDNGVLHLPHRSGISVPITSSEVDKKLVKMLSYSRIPLGFLSNKASEIYIEKHNCIMPQKLLYPGDLFGLFETVNSLCGIEEKPIWCVSSGARSLFMLPKIADKVGYQRIKKAFNLEIEQPRGLAEHWQIFVALCNHIDHIETWYNEVYFFTDKWFKKWECNIDSVNFYRYIFKESVIQKHYSNLNIEFDLDWNNFTMGINARNFRPRPYLLDTIKYLFAMNKGMLPGFKVADTSDIVAPITLLQRIYVYIYGLKYYLPTLMHPFNLMKDTNHRSVYYSLSFPSLLEGIPPYKNSTSDIISDLRLLKRLMNTTNGDLKNAHYEYFHSEADIYHEVKLTNELPSNDPTFLQDKKNFPDRSFCATAPFFSGCVRVTI